MIDLIVDLQYGSTGKGLLAGYLAEEIKHTAVITCNMPNAGHTYIDSDGNKMIHKVLPNGIVSPKLTDVFIGPGAVFSYEQLIKEIDHAKKCGYLMDQTIWIHPNAVPLLPEYTEFERSELNAIASTMQGSAAASVAKMMRPTDQNVIWGDHCHENTHPQINTPDHTHWMRMINHHLRNGRILAEGSQGFSLGVNQRFWPYCTSRECTPYRMLSDMGLPSFHSEEVHVWGTLRTFPIRVGNTPDGFSGGHYPDQDETDWSKLNQVPEKTTVTQRVRRVFDFSHQQLQEALWHCRPDALFLNFANYLSKDDLRQLTADINEYASPYNLRVDLMGFGPRYDDVKEAK